MTMSIFSLSRLSPVKKSRTLRFAFPSSHILPSCSDAFPARARTLTSGPPPPTLSPRHLSEGEQAIHNKLKDRFNPEELLVQDVSGGCGTFYAITIASAAFKGLPTVRQHRLVNEVLKKEIEGIHGLQLKTIPK